MGKLFADQYSLLHFSTGVIAYFCGIKFTQWFIIHLLFEIMENTDDGIHFIDHNLASWWPGGKKSPDYPINSIGDQTFAMLGFITATILDNYGKKYNLATVHKKL